MPYYEFECDTCGVIEEVFFRSIPREVPLHLDRDCAKCGGKTMKKIISRSTFHLKGGKVPWGEGRYSSAAAKGDDPVEINEP